MDTTIVGKAAEVAQWIDAYRPRIVDREELGALMTIYQPRAVPRHGLAEPVFEGLGPAEDLIVSLSFAPSLTDRQMRVMYRWLREMERLGSRRDPTGSPFAATEPFVHDQLFHARIGGTDDPRGAVAELVGDLTAAGARIKDSFFACWEWRADGVMGPRRDPRAPRETVTFDSALDYLDHLWDPSAVPPASELESELKGGFLAEGDLILEHRGTPLFFPGFRVAYGTVPCTRLPTDERTSEVRRTVVEALSEGWRTVFKSPGKRHIRPQPLGNDDSRVDLIERISCGTRVGYMFTIEAVQLLDRPSPTTCRYREYELMEALLTAVSRRSLAPIVNWRRNGTPMLVPPIKRPDTVDIQLWELVGDHRVHPGIADEPSPLTLG